MDALKNFAVGTVSTGYDASATSIALTSGHGARFPVAPFFGVWWNSTDYANPADDPNVEIVRVTARSTDTLTITRAQEGTSASTKNTGSKTYKLMQAVTAALLGQLLVVEIVVACSDETTNLATGTAKVTFRAPFAMTLSELRANVNTAPTGSTLIVDVNLNGSTMMTTNKLSIDASEETSETAATAHTLTTTAIADDDEITIDIDQVGSTVPGKGLKVTFIGTRS
jgi:hypothetical protein